MEATKRKYEIKVTKMDDDGVLRADLLIDGKAQQPGYGNKGMILTLIGGFYRESLREHGGNNFDFIVTQNGLELLTQDEINLATGAKEI